MQYQETSRAAWADHVPFTAALDRAIMEALSAASETGLTCQAIEEATGRNHQAVSGNLRHLAERGLVEKSGFIGFTSSGRQALKWRVNLMGPERVTAPSPRRNKLREAAEKAVRDLDAIAKTAGVGDPMEDVKTVAADLRRALEGRS